MISHVVKEFCPKWRYTHLGILLPTSSAPLQILVSLSMQKWE